MNSAGKIEPGWRAEELEAKNAFVPPRLLVELVSRGLFLCAPVPSSVSNAAADRVCNGCWHGNHALVPGCTAVEFISRAGVWVGRLEAPKCVCLVMLQAGLLSEW